MSGGGGGGSQSTKIERYTGIQVSTSLYGGAIPLVYGRQRVPFNLLWYGNFTSTAANNSSGGKGGGGGSGVSSYNYSTAFIAALGIGPMVGVSHVYHDKAIETLADEGLTLFLGGSGQATWTGYPAGTPTVQKIPYDHITYVADNSYNLGSSAALPNLTFEADALLGYSIAHGMFDADPSAIVVDYLTDAVHGAGFQGTIATLSGVTDTYQSYCMSLGLLISPVESSQRQASSFLDELLQITNSAPVLSVGVLKIIPYADAPVSGTTADGSSWSYTPDLTPLFSFGDSDYKPDQGEDPVKLTRKALTDTYNNVNVEYADRSNAYNTAIANAYDLGDITRTWIRTMSTLSFHQITQASVARTVSQLVLNTSLYERNTYEFSVRADFSLLEPMDYIAISDANLGLTNQVVRITSIDDDASDIITITAMEVPGTIRNTPLYDWSAAAGYAANYATAPGSVAAPQIFRLPPMLADSNVGGFQVGIAVCGPSSSAYWGGCNVYCSVDGGTTYGFVGKFTSAARYGTLTADLAAGVDPDSTHTLSIALANTNEALGTATNADADNMQTLLLVDTGTSVEVMSYGTATLTSAGHYNLTYLRRGQYGSASILHNSGVAFVRLDGNIFTLDFDPGLAGQTVYFKFTSFNTWGRAVEDVATVTAYSYLIPTFNGGQMLTAGTFIARGSCSVVGSKIFKSGSSGAWDSDCYSLDAYSAGCQLRFRAAQTNCYLMMGLNSDPTTDESYTSLDFAFYVYGTGGAIYIYESGANVAGPLAPTYDTSTIFSMTYDGISVRYFVNGVLQRKVEAPGKVLFFDSSFADPGGAVMDVYFGALNSSTAARLIPRGQCTVIGNSIQKIGGTGAWDSDCYSNEGFTGGCAVSWRRSANQGDSYMLALNTDPTANQSYTSLDYAIELFYSSGYKFDIYESGSQVVSSTASAPDDVFTIKYDGQWIRYYQNGTLIKQTSAPGLKLYMDSSFYGSGSTALDVNFGPLSEATPSPFIARGGCIVSDNTITKSGGVTATWDSDVYSIAGYPQCHVTWKSNPVANNYFMLGLSRNPTVDVAYTSIDYAWYCQGGNLEIYESGVSVGFSGGYDPSDVLAITYDGGHIKYWLNGISQRNVAVVGLTLFMDSSFHYIGSGLNSLRWGPGDTLPLIDTNQIGSNAATLTHHAQSGASTGITQLNHTPVQLQQFVSVTFTPTVSCTLRCTFTGIGVYTSGGSGVGWGGQIGIWNTSGAVPWVYALAVPNTASTTTQLSLAQTVDISCTAGVSVTIATGFAKLNSGDTLTIRYGDLAVEEIRR